MVWGVDRYHATGVQWDTHLVKCMVYIDLNMVRAGVVRHPSEWPFCGYNEIQNPPQRYALIDRQRLMGLLGIADTEGFREVYKGWVEEVLARGSHVREAKWSESIAVGSRSFVEEIMEKLGVKVSGRKVVEARDGYELKEAETPYRSAFEGEMGALRHKNSYPWRVYDSNSAR
jgi:putative transposase